MVKEAPDGLEEFKLHHPRSIRKRLHFEQCADIHSVLVDPCVALNV